MKKIYFYPQWCLLLSGLGLYATAYFFLGLLIINFVSNVHESPHDEINGGVLHVFAYF